MRTEEVLRELRSLSKREDWSNQVRPICNIRFKGPKDKRYWRNPLAALALHLHGKVNLRWVTPGATLGLDEDQVQDFVLASDTFWYRPLLRKQILKACGLEDERFDEAYRLMERLLGKTKLEKVSQILSAEDRFELESATAKTDLRTVEKVARKY